MNAAELVILVPTRLRPHTVTELADTFAQTCTAQTWLVFCIDDCPHAADYLAAGHARRAQYPRMLLLPSGQRRGLVATLNHVGRSAATGLSPPYAIGYLGDDHRPRTHGWDSAYLAALRELGTGIVYGDDEHQGANLPTQMAMTADIVAALGHVAAPTLRHMYCDNYWKDLGEGAGCLTYLPEVTITHCHPGTGRGTWDASYAETNSADSYAHDRAAYTAYRTDRLPADVAAVRRLRQRTHR